MRDAGAVLIGLLAVLSLWAWARVLDDWRQGRQPLAYRTRPAADWNPLLVPLIAGWVVFQTVMRLVGPEAEAEPSLQQVQASSSWYATIILIVWALMTRSGTQPVSNFGIDAAGWRAQLSIGAWAFCASWIPVYAMLLLMDRLDLRTEDVQHTFFKVLEEHPGPAAVFWIFLAAVVLAPLAEELMFRVVLQGWLQTRIAAGWAVVLVAVVFSLVHGWADALPLLPLSLILGYVYYRSYSYWAVVTTHVLFNATFLTIALLGRE